ncbi:MAG: trans-sulfuration enzyme family protein [Kiloniellales bacterium]
MNKRGGANDGLDPETLIAQAGESRDSASGGVVPAIHPATTFERDSGYRLVDARMGYARDLNPNVGTLESLLARLEGGAAALAFSSGMGAATALFRCLKPGDHVVTQKVMYWGLRAWIMEFCRDWGLELTLFDAAEEGSLERAVKPGLTRLVWIETPANPSWDVVDIVRAAQIAHDAGALLAVDSTVPTPLVTRPLALGADFVFHSGTKYLNGHSDVLAGFLVASKADDLWAQVGKQRTFGGTLLASFEAWLLLRGMRTLHLRVERSCENALAFARHFEKHPKLEAVLYPGLETHPGHAVAAEQMHDGFGGMLSIRVKGGRESALKAAGALKLIRRATSLGGTESLIEHRASVEDASSPVPPDLLRVSIGIEKVDDLIADLEQALAKV